MKKTITLIRHAKSFWEDESLADIDRPLGKKGKKQCKKIKKILEYININTENIFCSPAERCLETAKNIFSKNVLENMLIVEDIYLAHNREEKLEQKFLSCVEDLLAKFDNITIIGHDDGFTSLVEFIVGWKGISFSPLGIAEIEIDNFEKLGQSLGILKYYISPKSL